MEKVYIETNGCAVLRHETYKIAKYIELNDYEEVSNPHDANYIIMTGCAVIDENEDYAIESIKRLYDENKDHAKLIVTGCIPTIASKRIKDISSDIIQIDNKNMNLLDNFFGNKVKLSEVTFNINPKRHHSFGDPQIKIDDEELKDLDFANKMDDLLESDAIINQFNYSTRGRHLWRESDLFEIRVSYGCTGKCSYCATKLAIGDFKSVDENIILKQAQLASKLGYHRIMLMGDEIGAWHCGNKNIVDLIDDILMIDSAFKVGIRYIQPDIIVKNYERFRHLFETGTVSYFCSAFQSGSEKILKLMNRNPDIEPFIKCMEDMNKNNYPVIRHTQIIVGFPTETDLDFLKTIKCLQRASFDHVTISPYSRRYGTKAYDLEPLDDNIIKNRMEIINDWLKLNRNSKIYSKTRDEVNKVKTLKK